MSGPGFIAVTGATGAVGGRVARLLADAGVRLRLVVRDPARAPDLPGAEVAQATYDDAGALTEAFTGVDAVFLVSAAEHPERVRQHLTAVDAIKAAGVDRVVYTSFLGASADNTFTLGRHHWITEERLREHDLAYTALRDSLYLDFMSFMTGADGVIRGPAGDGRFAPVARDDVADVAVAVLLGEGHERRTYDVTGGRLQSFAEIAAELTEITGRPVSYHAETIEEAWASRAQYGAPDWEVEGWVSSYAAIGAGELAVVSDTVERLAGHPPLTLAALVERYPELVAALRDGR
jgi:NAD(P)H dehydrogenase (quinone)